MTVEKPPYRIPTMAEIDAVRGTNGLKMISTFSGCGGSCLGFEMAGFEILAASEFVEAARETYRANHPGVPVDGRDVREVTAAELLATSGLAEGELDVFEGSPPCASFSTAGKRAAKWGQESSYSDTKQRSDDLFFEFARLLGGLMPRAFVAENVSGLVKGVARGYFKEIHAALANCGYRVEARLLDAQWLGVPQVRLRVIFVGVRDDLAKDPAFPDPLPYRYSIRDALPGLGEGSGDDVEEDPETGYRISLTGTAIAPQWDKLAEGESSDRYFNLVRPESDKPCPTVTQSAGGRGTAGVTHPARRRKFTLLELRRVCGFPDDFELTGTYQQRWERLGRAVPPPMMRSVAETLRDRILT